MTLPWLDQGVSIFRIVCDNPRSHQRRKRNTSLSSSSWHGCTRRGRTKEMATTRWGSALSTRPTGPYSSRPSPPRGCRKDSGGSNPSRHSAPSMSTNRITPLDKVPCLPRKAYSELDCSDGSNGMNRKQIVSSLRKAFVISSREAQDNLGVSLRRLSGNQNNFNLGKKRPVLETIDCALQEVESHSAVLLHAK